MSRFYSIDDMIKCAIWEAGMRKRCLSKVDRAESDDTDKADWEIECMEAPFRNLKRLPGVKE